MTLHFLLRRSKAEGGQEHSLDTQRAGCAAFAVARGYAGKPVEHVSDGVAGDDAEGLVALRRLLEVVKPGDVVLCRDHSRLGRDMLESATTIRTLVQDRGAELHYYSTGERVQWRNAADGVMSVLRGFAAQSELEAIRSRTTEALRARATAGHVAGGACFGYRNVRQRDAGGRAWTLAVVDQVEAEVVRRIFAAYVEGDGYGAIAKQLNEEHVAAPGAGTKRGTRSWSPSAVRDILRRERYVGIYSHGKVKRKRENGKRVVTERDRASAVRTEMPEWRIVDDMTWRRAQVRIAQRAEAYAAGAGKGGAAPGARGKHPLTGIARCAGCGGALTLGHTKLSGGRRVRAYVCSYHWKRGRAVCPVSVAQPQDEVEELLAEHIVSKTLAPAIMAEVARQIRAEAEATFPAERGAADDLEAELAQLKLEQKRLARAVALAEDVDELAAELRDRSARIRVLEERLAVARQAPAQRLALVDELERRALAWMARVREALATSPENAREAYLALFPNGIAFRPSDAENGNRRVWVAEGVPELAGSNYSGDPTEDRCPVGPLLPRVCVTLRRAA